jgi:ABC-type branched-subunit amino acid transport system permease subunit
LKGDYLAIVTLGFGEIIRVIFRNIDSLGGALGLNGIPPYTNIFWVLAVAVHLHLRRPRDGSFHLRPRLSSPCATTKWPPKPWA